MTQSTPLHIVTRADDETPSDLETGFLDYHARQAFRDLRRLYGFEEARERMASIINDEREGRRQ